LRGEYSDSAADPGFDHVSDEFEQRQLHGFMEFVERRDVVSSGAIKQWRVELVGSVHGRWHELSGERGERKLPLSGTGVECGRTQ
jgi:hypothetical protein